MLFIIKAHITSPFTTCLSKRKQKTYSQWTQSKLLHPIFRKSSLPNRRRALAITSAPAHHVPDRAPTFKGCKTASQSFTASSPADGHPRHGGAPSVTHSPRQLHTNPHHSSPWSPAQSPTVTVQAQRQGPKTRATCAPASPRPWPSPRDQSAASGGGTRHTRRLRPSGSRTCRRGHR